MHVNQQVLDHQMLDEARKDAFGGLAVDILNKASLAVMMSVGHRTGLFETLAMLPPATPAEIADAARLHERYVKEWLGAMATGGIVEHDAGRGTYHLPPEHAAFLTRAAATNNMASFAQVIPLISQVEDGIVACFREGGGVPYAAFTRFPEVMRELSAPTFDTLLVDRMLPLVPGLTASLERGIDVLDVGCGSGRAINVMARAFPKSRFAGFDLIPESIEAARAEAAALGLSNVRFDVQDATTLGLKDHYELVTAFDTVHDQARPAALLRQVVSSLKKGGTFLMWDVDASSHVHGNRDHLLGPFLYTVSCMHCMTVSLAQNGEGLGAMWGREKAEQMLADAGLAGVSVHRIDEDPVNCCYVATKA